MNKPYNILLFIAITVAIFATCNDANGQTFTYTSTNQASWSNEIPDTIYLPEGADTVGIYLLPSLYTEYPPYLEDCGGLQVLEGEGRYTGDLAYTRLTRCSDGGLYPVSLTAASNGDEGFWTIKDSQERNILVISVQVVDVLPQGKTGTFTVTEASVGEGGEEWGINNICDYAGYSDSETCTGAVRPDAIGEGVARDYYGFGTPDTVITSAERYNADLVILKAFPNPFNPFVNVEYTGVPADEYVRLSVYDILGKQVEVLFEGYASEYRTSWDASGYPTGGYYVLLRSASVHSVQNILLVK